MWNFDEKAATEAAAFFMNKAGGRIDLFRLLKILYLAERESIKTRGVSITGDRLVSMRHGMLPSRIYDLAKGALVREKSPYWALHVSERFANELELIEDPGCGNLLPDDVKILEETWKNFSELSNPQLRSHHHSLREWEDPGNSSVAIDPRKILEDAGLTKAEIELWVEAQNEYAREATFIRKHGLAAEESVEFAT